MIPDLPASGPCHHWDGKPCQLVCDHDRPRKTGPGFALLVVRCRTHGVAFTLYPPGHVPYGRKPLVPMAPDGSLWVGSKQAHPFAGTVFDAALDAAEGEAWPADFDDEHPTSNSKPRFGTQLTHLARACELTGVGQAPGWRELCSQVLAVPGQLLHDLTQRIELSPGYRSRGGAVCEVLSSLALGPALYERLCACGTAAGLWPPLYQWQPDLRRLQPSRFERPGTRAPPVTGGGRGRPQLA
jgi:hypothetical protein